MRITILTLLFVLAFGRCAVAQERQGADARSIVKRALPYVLSGGMEWRTEKKCASCHRTTFTSWALNRAAESGFSLEVETVQDWNAWSRNWENHVAEKRRGEATREDTLLAENDSVAQLLLGRSMWETDDSAWVAEYRSFLAKAQNEDGSWKAGGQLPSQKRPKRETQEVSTMWALVALSDSGTNDEIMRETIANAAKWLGTETQGKSIEWWAVRLLLQVAADDSAAASKSRETILSHQNDDGGWGWLIKDDSDALGTGIVLYALKKSGQLTTAKGAPIVPTMEVTKAIAFLLRTQEPDGSWPVNGTKKNSDDHVTDTAAYWGACWAVIGVCEPSSFPVVATEGEER